ncbi:hypothetical protein GFV12_02165 [Desulfurobacterium thermolithotrophum]|uniref:hypothetical protein n=1 Tax=Desulfurobacterium thermolithotrophum TaxID=64160 RepID=UPI0013D8489C|nr:hypothetical protein [Desulfurobacterium thermolithotrophum]
MKIKNRFEDERYILVCANWEGSEFIYFKDKLQNTETLAIPSKPLDPKVFWRKHKEDESYCLPCELFLHCDSKVMTADNVIVEWGLTLERLNRFKTLIEKID